MKVIKYYCDFCSDEITTKEIIVLHDNTDNRHFCDFDCLELYCKEKKEKE